MTNIDLLFAVTNGVLVAIVVCLLIIMLKVGMGRLNGYKKLRLIIIWCLFSMLIVKALLALDDAKIIDRDDLGWRTLQELGCIGVVWSFFRMFRFSIHKAAEPPKEWGDFKVPTKQEREQQ